MNKDTEILERSEKLTLKEFLDRQTKSKLDEMRKALELQGVSSLKKVELIAVLEDSIKKRLKDLLMLLDMSEYSLLIKAVNGEGIIKWSESLKTKFNYLNKLGIIYPASLENYGLCEIIPSDILDQYTGLMHKFEVISRIKLNDKICNISRGILYYYGVLSSNRLFDMVDELIDVKLDPYSKYPLIYANLYKANNYSGELFYNSDIGDYQKVLKEQQSRQDLPYLPLTLKRVLEAGKADYKEWTIYDKEMYTFLLNNYDITEDMATKRVDSFVYAFKNGDAFPDIIGYLQQNFEFVDAEQLQRMVTILQNEYNHTREYFLKGHSPEEVNILDNPQIAPFLTTPYNLINKKVGRNDFCPCGSGKKYKNCCLDKDI